MYVPMETNIPWPNGNNDQSRMASVLNMEQGWNHQKLNVSCVFIKNWIWFSEQISYLHYHYYFHSTFSIIFFTNIMIKFEEFSENYNRKCKQYVWVGWKYENSDEKREKGNESIKPQVLYHIALEFTLFWRPHRKYHLECYGVGYERFALYRLYYTLYIS